jgi:iron complex outermembrane recepter protein
MMERARWGAATLIVAFLAGLPNIARAEDFDVPAGRLGEVAAALGAQAGVTVTVTEPEVATRHSPGVVGNFTLRAALDRALQGTEAEAVFYDRATIRIVGQQRTGPAPRQAESGSNTLDHPEEVVVTASKQSMRPDNYPGSVEVMEVDAGWIAGNAMDGTAAITKSLPVLGSTNLGPGRDKLFIRGIADSSFNGPTQATVGQYLGDVRLNYNAPDPDLNLYDIKRIEVLVGPQGTLYGTGSLGGVIRLVPNEPDAREFAATASGGSSSTRSGGISGDGAAMFNVPLVDGLIAFRLVAYGTREAGYIDDPSRGLQDINSSASYGQRLTFRVQDLGGWSVDLGVVLQNISSADGQYALSDDQPLTRGSTIAQPFRNAYRMLFLAGRSNIGDAQIVSTTSTVWHHLQTSFDATGYDDTTTPARFKEDDEIKLFSHETRIAGSSYRSPWVTGVSTLFTSNTLSRSLGPLSTPARSADVVNVQAEVALFGQISYPLTRTLTGTLGERVTLASGTGVLADQALYGMQMSSRSGVFFSNTLALDWHPGGPLSTFFHYQQGYRAGGLAVAPSSSGLQSQKFDADELNMDEFGLRWGDEAHDPVSVRSAVFFADWNNIQADMVDASGLPYTTNIGHGWIFGLNGEVTWRPMPGLTFSAATFINESRLSRPKPAFALADSQTLPNVAGDGGRIATEWRGQVGHNLILSAQSAVRYVGLSKLGVGRFLDISQGDYFVVDSGARLDFGNFALSLNLDNLADVRANTFAFGNPFGLALRDQTTPLRPRTVRLGVDARF